MKLIRLLSLLLLAAPSAFAQDASAAMPSAREVIDRHAKACNLTEVLAQKHSMHVLGKFSMAAMGIEGTAEIWSAKPAMRKTSMVMGNFGQMVTGYDGKVAWMTHPMVGARIAKGTELLQSRLEADWNAALKTGGQYESLRTVGRESFEGKECWKVEVVAKPLEGMDPQATLEARTSFEYYEIEGGLLIGTKGKQESDLGSGPFTQIFSDYKDFGGMRMATKTTVRQSGQEIVLQLDSVEFDTLDEAFFKLPADVQTMLDAASKAPEPATPR
jgi:hypothetical protein